MVMGQYPRLPNMSHQLLAKLPCGHVDRLPNDLAANGERGSNGWLCHCHYGIGAILQGKCDLVLKWSWQWLRRQPSDFCDYKICYWKVCNPEVLVNK